MPNQPIVSSLDPEIECSYDRGVEFEVETDEDEADVEFGGDAGCESITDFDEDDVVEMVQKVRGTRAEES